MLTRHMLSDQQMTVQASTVLKVLGRSTLFILDILLRESVQNSLDATNLSTGFITFEFDILPLASHDELAARLEFLRQDEDDQLFTRLQSRFRQGDPVLLTLSDKGTTGLSGPVRRDAPEWSSYDGHRNFDSLVYQLGRNHGDSKAGGSYGFGKSILYRLSPAGIVLFYSRSVEGERLAFSMISAEENKIRQNYTGIAWWGEVCEFDGQRYSAPVEDPEKIGEVLSALGLSHKRLPEGETGTLIGVIAPRLQYLLNTERDSHDDIPEVQQSDTDSKIRLIKNAVAQSVQKWYWPRMTITNEVKPDGLLKPLRFLNFGEEIQLAPQYVAMGSLLKAAENYNNNDTTSLPGCVVESINHNYGSVMLGTLAYQIIGQKASMDHLNKIAMIRWPRMVVFEIPVQERGNRSVAALFLVNSKVEVRPNRHSTDFQELDNVFKDCESATHSEWNYQGMDPDKNWFKSYVKAAREKTVDALRVALNPTTPNTTEAEFSPSAKLLGQLLLSSGGGVVQTFTANGSGGGGGNGAGGRRPTYPGLDIQSPVYLPDGDLLFEINLTNITIGDYKIAVLARGGSQSLDQSSWKKRLGNEFPFIIRTVKHDGTLSIRTSEEAELLFSYDGSGDITAPLIVTIHPVKKDALISFRISPINE